MNSDDSERKIGLMWELLTSPIDPARVHDIGLGISWHGRLMVFAWAFLSPIAILMARYFKIMPGQNWPQELDNKSWWLAHWMSHSVGMIVSGLALILVLVASGNEGQAQLHRVLGYLGLLLGSLQVMSGIFRGSKGGPTEPKPDGSLTGDHYDMTPHRQLFERAHKTLGYLAVVLMMAAILTGLWQANALIWMWVAILVWWFFLLALAVYLQVGGRAVDTYQTIWGPDLSHPGNRIQKLGWGMVRPVDKVKITQPRGNE